MKNLNTFIGYIFLYEINKHKKLLLEFNIKQSFVYLKSLFSKKRSDAV